MLADSAVEGALPANACVRLFRASTKAGRGLRFETALVSELAHRPRPAAVLVSDGEVRVIRRRETVDDLLALESG